MRSSDVARCQSCGGEKIDTLTNGLTDVQKVTYRVIAFAEKDHWFSRKLRLKAR